MQKWLIVCGALLVLAYFLSPSARSKRLRFVMTVEVITPDGVRTGSSVLEASITGQLPLMGADSVRYDFKGEAIPIDLTEQVTLFALLDDSSYYVDLPTRGLIRGTSVPPIAPKQGPPRNAPDWPELRRKKPIITLSNEDYPTRFAYFQRIDDPKSIREVDSANLTLELGDGYAISRVTIQPTDQPISSQIDKRLPWLATADDYLGSEYARSRSIGVHRFRHK